MDNLDLYAYAERQGIIVDTSSRVPLTKSTSVQIHDLNIIGIDTSVIQNSAEERVHLGHELGHCETGYFYETDSPRCVRMIAEAKATRWSVRKLIPKDELVDLLRSGVETWDLAEHFNVPEDFIRTACRLYFEDGMTA